MKSKIRNVLKMSWVTKNPKTYGEAMDNATNDIHYLIEDEFVKPLKTIEQNILQLCDMVNTYSNKLGLGDKVKAEDFIEKVNEITVKTTGTKNENL